MITGYGKTLVKNPDAPVITFTSSVGTGKQIKLGDPMNNATDKCHMSSNNHHDNSNVNVKQSC